MPADRPAPTARTARAARPHRQAPGVLFGLYLVIAGMERFLIEFIRRNDAVLAGLTQAQLIALGMLALGAGILATRRAAWRPATA